MSISLFATRSLKAIDQWLDTCNSNLVGNTMVAFRQSEIMYGGNVVSIERTPTQQKSGIMVAEQSLTTGYTKIDWTAGSIVSSTQNTHFAIQGQGFFLAVDPRLMTSFDASTTSPNPNTTPGVYLTRDGEFHWAVVRNAAGVNIAGTVPPIAPETTATDELVLVNKSGLLVMADISDNDAGPPGNTNYGESNNIYRMIRKTDFDNDVAVRGYLPDGIRVRPSVVEASYDAPGTTGPSSVADYDELKFSKYGSTVFEPRNVNSIKTIVNGSAGNSDRRSDGYPGAAANDPNPGDPAIAGVAPGAQSASQLVENALEASNTRVEVNITEMAMLGKVYNGFIQLIKAYNSGMDEVLGFIR